MGRTFLRLSRLRGGVFHCPTPLLHNDQEKNSVVRFHGFRPKRWRRGVVDPINHLKSLAKWLQLTFSNIHRISGATKVRVNQFIEFGKGYNGTDFYVYICLICVNRTKNCSRKLSFHFCNTKRDHLVPTCFIVCIDKVWHEVKISWKLGKKYILTSTKEIWNFKL